jgi:dephospho-CoA kinase
MDNLLRLSIIHYSLSIIMLIGITGGIGSGKSTVCQLFRALGAPVYEADDRAKWLTNHDPILRADILRLLGPEAYTEAGTYNRPWVATQVFADPNLLQQLNSLIHPRVWADSAAWVQTNARKPYLIYEAALMRAAGDGNALDTVVVVSAPETLRIQRVRQRDPHRSEPEIRKIIQNQISDDDRARIADVVVKNDESELLIPQVLTLHEQFIKA